MKTLERNSTASLMDLTRSNVKMIGAAIEDRIRQKSLSSEERKELIEELQTVISLLERVKVPVI